MMRNILRSDQDHTIRRETKEGRGEGRERREGGEEERRGQEISERE